MTSIEHAPEYPMAEDETPRCTEDCPACDAALPDPDPYADSPNTGAPHTGPVTTGTGLGAVTDCHTGWDCTNGASLLAHITGPGRGRLPAEHGVIYVCPDHQAQAEARITAAGHQPDTRPAPPGHRWDPWPCGHITTYGTSGPQLALTLTRPVATAEQAPTPVQPAPRHASLDALLGAVAEQLPPDDPDRSAQTLARMTTPSERAALSNSYAHARRADDAEAARAEAVRWAAVVEGTLDRVRGVLNTWAGYTLEPGQVRRLLDEVTRALCDEPAVVTITMDAAAHVLAQDGYDGGYPPGQYIGRLLTAWWSADPDHAARLATAYPVYGAAIALLRSPGGPEQLRAVAIGQSTCRVAEVDGEPIRVFALGALSDEDATTLIEGVADMRRRGKAAADEPAPADACRLVDVDGEQILVRGDGDLTAEDHAALTEVVEAARRRYAAEHPDADAREA